MTSTKPCKPVILSQDISTLTTLPLRSVFILVALVYYLLHASLTHLNHNGTTAATQGPAATTNTSGASPGLTLKHITENFYPKVPKQFGYPSRAGGSPLTSYPPRHRHRPRDQPRSPFDPIFEESDMYRSMYSSYADPDYNHVIASDCAGYYCAETDTCVDEPIECPCPSMLDTKCLRGDWYVCYRGDQHSC